MTERATIPVRTRANAFHLPNPAAEIPREESADTGLRKANEAEQGLRLGISYRITESSTARHWMVLRSLTPATEEDRRTLLGQGTVAQNDVYTCNIENFVGCVSVPVGVVGPLKMQGDFAKGDFFLPLATTEAALVASYGRGVNLMTESGGCTATIIDQKLGRAPLFEFRNLKEVKQFVAWVAENRDRLGDAAQCTTRFGNLCGVHPVINGNQVFLLLEFSTGDAAGQNMTTIATDAICQVILDTCPIKPRHMAIESNYCGDKKATARSFTTVRGKRVTAEAAIPRHLLEKRLGVTPERMVTTWQNGALGAMMSGALGVQAHYANGLAALFLATGQDVACVAECAVGVTRFQQTAEGDLYASVTLPNLVVGSVGGGTGLPTQSACLRIANCSGDGSAAIFAELCAGLCLAGELSLIAAIADNNFARAHQRLARNRGSSSRRKVDAP